MNSPNISPDAGFAITSGLPQASTARRTEARSRRRASRLPCWDRGIDVIYPRSNRTLSLEIQQQGALISAFPLGIPPRRENFPQRNSIIAGLSLGLW